MEARKKILHINSHRTDVSRAMPGPNEFGGTNDRITQRWVGWGGKGDAVGGWAEPLRQSSLLTVMPQSLKAKA